MAVPSTQRRMGALLADGYLRMAHTPLSSRFRPLYHAARRAVKHFSPISDRERLKIQIREILKDILRNREIESVYL